MNTNKFFQAHRTTSIISLFALVSFVIAMPVYAAYEPARMQSTQIELRQQYLDEGAGLYIRFCAVCHGEKGEGRGAMPALDHPALAEADPDSLYEIIARAAHGTAMAAWHIAEGGVLNDYQIGQIITLIQYSGWDKVATMAARSGFEIPPLPAEEMGEAFLQVEDEDDPHRCVSCHEDPKVHKGQFGLNCGRCHSSVAWTPAQLTKHVFELDHGGEGLRVDCSVCHVFNYQTHTCYGCHDHTEEQMEEVHLAEDIKDYEACVTCHPTGQPDEGALYVDQP